ncbi:MAG: DUF1778 domain-containing protein [Nocardioides sp.]|uniref:type II toxin-antitoxin system TacA family antitoxin n=1 Tax=Nocardioides sp. TaxID=35761 RepID=UPI0039E2F017
MSAASERLEFRVQAEKKARITRAATILHLPVGEFARSAAEEKADRIIREHEATTVVPAEFFDDMLAALDMPAQPTPALVEAMRRARDMVTQD